MHTTIMSGTGGTSRPQPTDRTAFDNTVTLRAKGGAAAQARYLHASGPRALDGNSGTARETTCALSVQRYDSCTQFRGAAFAPLGCGEFQASSRSCRHPLPRVGGRSTPNRPLTAGVVSMQGDAMGHARRPPSNRGDEYSGAGSAAYTACAARAARTSASSNAGSSSDCRQARVVHRSARAIRAGSNLGGRGIWSVPSLACTRSRYAFAWRCRANARTASPATVSSPSITP